LKTLQARKSNSVTGILLNRLGAEIDRYPQI